MWTKEGFERHLITHVGLCLKCAEAVAKTQFEGPKKGVTVLMCTDCMKKLIADYEHVTGVPVEVTGKQH